MKELFEALKNLPPVKKKIHTVTIQGRTVEVTLQKKIEVMNTGGESNYHWVSPTEFERKPVIKPKRLFPILAKSDKGYVFNNGDPYWVEGIDEGGHTWQTPSE